MARPELDPRLWIARANQYADHDTAGGWHAVNIERADSATGSRREQLRALLQQLGQHGRIDTAQLDAPDDLPVTTAEVTARGLQMLEDLVRAPADEQHPLLRRFEYAQPLKPPRLRPVPGLRLPDANAAATLAARAPAQQRAQPGAIREVFAVIDHGCPFMHPLLCTQTGGRRSTRVRALWDQQVNPQADPRTAPKGFRYGAELSRAQLNAVIGAAAGDEGRAYDMLGYQALRLRASHGAHARGMLLDDGLRPRGATRQGAAPDVLFVQLPQGLLGAPNRATLSRHVMDALVWIQSQCAPDERVILSLSEGSSQGPNDGSSIVERALQAFTQWGPSTRSTPAGWARNRIYIAAGNGHEEKLHAQANLKALQAVSFMWRVPPASELPASVEIWLPDHANGAMADVQLDLFAPDGRRVASVSPGQLAQAPAASAPAGPAAAIASIASTAWRGDSCSLSLIRLAPTAAATGRVCAPFGDWTIMLTAPGDLQQDVHLYIGRIKPALGFPLRTAQSTFVIEGPAAADGALGAGTLQGLATAQGVVRVGGVVGVQARAGAKPGNGPPQARYSARGPSRNGAVPGPDLQVRTDDGAVLQGRRSIGNRSGVSFRMDGTSVGAPLAARLDRSVTGRSLPASSDGKVLLDPFDA